MAGILPSAVLINFAVELVRVFPEDDSMQSSLVTLTLLHVLIRLFKPLAGHRGDTLLKRVTVLVQRIHGIDQLRSEVWAVKLSTNRFNDLKPSDMLRQAQVINLPPFPQRKWMTF